jgi:sugar transferase (PEP-CTERM/EpsH1 system associated)
VRILFLTHRLPYAPNRGDRIRAYHLLRYLGIHAQVDLLSLVHDAEEAGHAGELDSLVASTTIARVPKAMNLARAVAAMAGDRPITHALLDSPEIRPALQTICASRPPDVVLAYCSGMAQYLFEPCLRDIPSVIDMVDVDSLKWAQLAGSVTAPRSWVYRREARQLARFEARAVQHARVALTVNAREHQRLTELVPSGRVETVENGIDYRYFAPSAEPQQAPHVVFCGVMNYAPNVEGAIWMAQHVWPIVRARRPDAVLTIVGAYPTRQVLRLANSNLGVKIAGGVPDVRPHLWNAAVAVAPIWLARGLQNKVLEALAAGLPCVVTPPVSEGLPREPREQCPIGDAASSFAGHVLTLLDMSAAERRRKAIAANVKALDWSVQLSAVMTILEGAARSA